MKLHIKQEGGFTGSHREVDIDTTTLSEADRRKLYDILRDSKLFESPRQSEAPGSDFFHYKIEATGFAEFYAPGTPEHIRDLMELTKSEKIK